MSQTRKPVFVDAVNWTQVLPWLRLFRSFRMAIRPIKLLLALLLVVALYLSGRLLDGMLGPRAFTNELGQYRILAPEDFQRLRIERQESLKRQAASNRSGRPGAAPQMRGVFETALAYNVTAFERLVDAAANLRFGFGEVLRGRLAEPQTVVGSLYDMLVATPGWIFQHHRPFCFAYGGVCLLLLAVAGGALARLAALDAVGSGAYSVMDGLRFSLSRLFWFVLTPIFPLLMVGFIGVLLMAGGFVFFNLPGLNMLGGLLYGLALLGGFAIALILLLLAAGGHMLFPALAVEGTDTFDAVSRSFGYVIARPWHCLFYTLLAIVYGAVGYLFFGALVFLTLLATHHFVSQGVVREATEGVNAFNQLTQAPKFGQLIYPLNWDQQAGFTGKVSAALIWTWVFMLTALLAAYAISFYYSANTWIYLLLRRTCDGTEFDEICPGPRASTPPPAADPQAAPVSAEAAAASNASASDDGDNQA